MQGGQQRRRQHVGTMPGVGQQPLRHVAGTGVDAGGRGDTVVGRLRHQRHPAVAAAHVRTRPARAGLDAGQAEAGIVHAQRLEDAALDRLFVEAARGGIDHVADQAEGHVLVGVAVARQALEAGVGQLLGQRVVLGIAFDVAIVGVVGQADAVAEHIGHGQAVGGFGRVEAEARHVVGHLAVPAQRAVVDQQAGHGAGKGLGQRRQAEHGVRVDRQRVVDVGDAVAARAEHAAALHDGHGHARHALAIGELLRHRFDMGDVEAGGRQLHLRHQAGAVGRRLGVGDARTRGGFDVGRHRRQGRRCLRGGGQGHGHQHAQQTGGRRPDRATQVVHFHRLDPCATAVCDSSAAFRLCTNKAKMNAHLIEKVGFLTPGEGGLDGPADALHMSPPGGIAHGLLAMLQCIV